MRVTISLLLLMQGCTRAAPPTQASTPAMVEVDCSEAREGQPCPEGASYCVVDWGEPGGHSSALWCEDGTWRMEQEANLPLEGE